MTVDVRRVRAQNASDVNTGPVLYWMQRDQRVHDNWALLYAQEVALARAVPLIVAFNVVPTYGNATLRGYDFMLRGLAEVEETLKQLSIPFILTLGDPVSSMAALVSRVGAGEVVVDFNPLRHTTAWRRELAQALTVRLTEVDAHNIIPCWVASPKEEFAAYTFRPKVHKLLREFLTNFPKVVSHPYVSKNSTPTVDWEKVATSVTADRTVAPVTWLVPGSQAAVKQLKDFCVKRLPNYALRRNDPTLDGQSNLSPYLHFGQLSAQRVALCVQAALEAPKEARDTYLEELIVRRELADNYCYYNQDYDKVTGAHAWAQKTIAEHVTDVREYVYTCDELEVGKTHDDLWNAMQGQLVQSGKLHGWCRMYWAKKIMEWTPNVQTAIDYALYLNDRYELDGNDPNGVVGVMWSICGVHDRAWNTRNIFGKVRYMNYAGAKRKFDIKAYIETWSPKPTLW